MRHSLVIIGGCAALAGCNSGDVSGGPTVSRNYQVGAFDKIEVDGSYDVDVRTGGGPLITARGPQKVLDKTVVEVQGDKLVIHPESDHSFFHFGFSDGSVHVTVTVPQLSAATIAGSGDIKVDKVQGQSFDGTVAGSGGIDLGSAVVQQLKLSIQGSGNAKAHAGKTQAADYGIGGSGDIDASQVESQQAKIEIAGSGNVRAKATSTANVNIMGSGDVTVTGGAKCTVSKAGSGSANCS